VSNADASTASSGLLGVLVIARNEEASLGPCLQAWKAALAHRALDEAPLLAVLDRCTDRSEEVARECGVEILRSGPEEPSSTRSSARAGKIAAQTLGLAALQARAPRVAATPSAFVVSSDADVLVEPTVLVALEEAMRDAAVHVAFPDKHPLPPRRRSLLARSLFTYNRRHGFASRRTWFSGQVFAIRAGDLHFPSSEDVAARAARLPRDRFLRLEQPLQADDVYLSQAVVAVHGIAALKQVDAAFWYRGPETAAAMYRRYRRMQAELERVSQLFPELAPVRRAFGMRRYDRLASSPWHERLHFHVVQNAVRLCQVGYWLEGLYHRRLATHPLDLWPPLSDTKLRADDAQVWSTSNCGTPSSTDARSSPGETIPHSPPASPQR